MEQRTKLGFGSFVLFGLARLLIAIFVTFIHVLIGLVLCIYEATMQGHNPWRDDH
jgi:hypothetical protein